ncbi:hypothetical protein [Streptomyces nogalater]|uniref:Uncharacterized protein n=1 Tax=Streptomyces nogalater TaxID=38314 RepID=A0ABW0WC10_STRNO
MADSAPFGLELGGVFERVLDQAISLGQVVEAMERCGSLIDRAELRTRALGAIHAIAAFADIEYREYLAAVTASSVRRNGRRALRAPAPPSSAPVPPSSASALVPPSRVAGPPSRTSGPESRAPGTASHGALPPSHAAGLPGRAAGAPSSAPAMRVSASVGLVLLLSGYGMRSSGALPGAGDGLLTAGLLLGALAVGVAVGDLVRRSGPVRGDRPDGSGAVAGSADTVARARQAWELALLERGVVPFLLGRLEEARLGQRRDHAGR